jgi:hypothetical protein
MIDARTGRQPVGDKGRGGVDRRVTAEIEADIVGELQRARAKDQPAGAERSTPPFNVVAPV